MRHLLIEQMPHFILLPNQANSSSKAPHVCGGSVSRRGLQPLRRKPRSPAGGTTSVKAHTFIPSHSSGGGPGEGLLLEKPPSPESSSLRSQLLLRCRERDGEGRADAGLAADTDFSTVCNYNNACNAQA